MVEGISPSILLRKWYTHDESKWNEFKNRYYQELQDKEEFISLLLEKTRKETITYYIAQRKINTIMQLH